ncbi:MAG: hypothetical protein ACXWP5_14655, partial [Bdellovibrionota bacterium]
MKALLGILILFAPFSSWAEVNFNDHGKPLKSVALEDLRAQIPAESVQIFEPHEEAEMTFNALPLVAVLDRIYGPKWREAEEIFFICADGYRDPIAVADLVKNPGWLAFAREGAPFAITEKKPKVREVPLAPLFLIRGSGRDLAARSLEKEGWPYQIVGIDLVEFADRFPGLLPTK